MNIRLWGGPACGQQFPDVYGERWSIVRCPRRHISEMMDTAGEMYCQIQIERCDYQISEFRDSQGTRVFLFPSAGKWLLAHFNEMRDEFMMQNSCRKPKCLVVPKVVWHKAEREYLLVGDMSYGHQRSLADTMGLHIEYGDETKFLAKAPQQDRADREQAANNLYLAAQQAYSSLSEEERRSTLDRAREAGYVRAVEMMESFDVVQLPRSDSRWTVGVDVGQANPTHAVTATESMEASRRASTGVAPFTNTVRRNQVTIYSNGESGHAGFRLIIQKGTKLDPDHKARIHAQYQQALKNWHLQYVENSDLI